MTQTPDPACTEWTSLYQIFKYLSSIFFEKNISLNISKNSACFFGKKALQ